MSLISEENHCVSMHDLYSDQILIILTAFKEKAVKKSVRSNYSVL